MIPSYHLTQMDAVEWLRSLPSESADLVVTDPAYESLEKHRNGGPCARLVDWFEIFSNERFPDLLREMWRVLRPDTHAYIMTDAETMFVVKPMAEAAGFKFWKPLVWDKQRIGMGYHYRARTEFILFFEKGKRRLNDLSIPDILSFPRVEHGYPTEKPFELCKVLVQQSTQFGDTVLDPFMGSGSVGVASLLAGRHFRGCDIAARSIALAESRLAPCFSRWVLPRQDPRQMSLFQGQVDR